MPLAFALAALALLSPVDPPSAEAKRLAERLSQVGLFGALAEPVTSAQVQEVVAAHSELSGERRSRMIDVAYAAREEAVKRLSAAEAEILAQSLNPDQLRGAVAFFESPAGRAYRNVFPVLVMKMGQTEQGRDFSGYVARRVCDDAKVCPPAK